MPKKPRYRSVLRSKGIPGYNCLKPGVFLDDPSGKAASRRRYYTDGFIPLQVFSTVSTFCGFAPGPNSHCATQPPLTHSVS